MIPGMYGMQKADKTGKSRQPDLCTPYQIAPEYMDKNGFMGKNPDRRKKGLRSGCTCDNIINVYIMCTGSVCL